MQDVVVILPAQVISDVGEGSASRFGHTVVNDHNVFSVGQRHRRVPLPQQPVLRVPLFNLPNLMPGNGPLCSEVRKQEKGTERKTVRVNRMNQIGSVS